MIHRSGNGNQGEATGKGIQSLQSDVCIIWADSVGVGMHRSCRYDGDGEGEGGMSNSNSNSQQVYTNKT